MNRKPTIKDVARLAGVSVGTASRVLNGNSATSEASRSAVRSAAQELGYLSNAHTKVVAVCPQWRHRVGRTRYPQPVLC